MKITKAALLCLLMCGATAWPQANLSPPGWFEGDALTETTLSGTWWLKLPFTMEDKDKGVAVLKQETILASKYLRFGANGVIYRSTLSPNESPSAMGVWLLKDEKLFLTFSNVDLELSYYLVRDDRILVAGTAIKGKSQSAVVGILSRVREIEPEPMIEE